MQQLVNSNYRQLLLLRNEDDKYISEWLFNELMTNLLPLLYKNEMINDLANAVLREISSKMKRANLFTLMADETADISKPRTSCCMYSMGTGMT